ncbi:hypothetical protein SSBR45G_09670 [Bradyrhizobium sp. SSBR45G]|uniref:general secretion pathway protein GspN n=1 Tax=unclassified Bradyrhizobium TaxID=2631580 RepID=UPI002342B970|nr:MULTISPECIES: general secretion pathway protein GspN [unclassified Bradyrhizobium]GLH76059.1 hypothetical protein SSBR45G_09670 [Bradyrhizobium sp. SSBR45G]GLH83457.1 hypothetical protein SSBR45R_09170 [Bradyrhizobium sp. SSBR45R]
MRSFVNSSAVALVMACVLGGALGHARGEDSDALEPRGPAQAESASHDGDPQTVDSMTSPRTAAAGTAAGSANPLWDVPLDALSATRDRPIFSASRRPPPPVVAPVTVMRAPPPPPREPERPTLQLVGTVIGDEESFGIFVDPATQKSLRLRVGASHEGWLLDAVKPREVTLRRELEIVTLPMPQLGQFTEDAPAPAAPAARDRMARRAR